jgi:hypothetical protein
MRVEKINNTTFQVWINDKKAIVIRANNKKEAEKIAKNKKF